MLIKHRFKNNVLPHLPILPRKFFPRHLVVEPTNRCNLKCVFCLRSVMTRPIGDMKLATFESLILQVPSLKRVSLFFMGEPFLNSDIFGMIDFAEERGIKTSIATNSTILPMKILDSELSKITFSLDGMSQETIEKYRQGSNYEKVIKGIERVCQEKRNQHRTKPYTKIRFLAFRFNEHEIQSVLQFARKTGIDECVIVKSILDYGNPFASKEILSQWMAQNPKYQRYDKTGRLLGKLPFCSWIWTPVVTWDGNVVPCCFDTDNRLVIGNIHDTPFQTIYWSRKYREIRKRMIKRGLAICKTCKEIGDAEVQT